MPPACLEMVSRALYNAKSHRNVRVGAGTMTAHYMRCWGLGEASGVGAFIPHASILWVNMRDEKNGCLTVRDKRKDRKVHDR